LFFYNKIGSIISIGDLPTTNIIEPKYDQIVGEMGIESTHDNHLVLKNRQLRFLAMIIIACLKQESKSVDKEVSYW
ncbi:hypothetical protein, partial [Streptococcus mitis]|uniref:hypothetical protein n=1 Tax=Streptococcus mitis TaxID=28037 RepID=UPI002000E5C8